MGKLIEWTNEGPAIVVNQRGERILLNPDVSYILDDLVGARVCVKRSHGHVTCEAAVPESTGLFRWTFDMDGDDSIDVEGNRESKGAKSLAALIAETRIELNGRL